MNLFKRGQKSPENSEKPNGTPENSIEQKPSGVSSVYYSIELPGGSPNINDNADFKTHSNSAANTMKTLRQSFLHILFDKKLWPRRLTIIIFAFVTVAAISFALLWQVDNKAVYRQQAGEVTQDEVNAPKEISYSSKVLTKEAQERNANSSANDVYRRDESTVSIEREAQRKLMETISNVRSLGPLAIPALNNDPQVLAAKLTDTDLKSIIFLSDTKWTSVAAEARNSFNSVMTRNISPEQLPDELTRLNNSVYTPWNLSPSFTQLEVADRQSAITLVKPFIAANNMLDVEATKRKRDDARSSTPSVIESIGKGQNVVRKGERLTALQIEMMEQLGLRNNFLNWETITGMVGIIAMLILVLCFYFSQLASQIWNNRKTLAFIALSLTVAAIAIRLLISSDERTLRPYLLPLAAIAMVVAALLDVQLAILLTAILALLVGLVSGNPELTLVYFSGGSVGALILWKAERTTAFAFAGLGVIIAQFTVGVCYYLVINSLDASTLGLMLVFNLASGLVSASLAFFSYSILGKLFGVTTVIQLLELAHPNQPLLRRLMREAPGTYHHSMLVGTLAEQAAESLAGDALLARVGAYYHDIGKLERPLYFIDNQGSGPNIHDTLDPSQSAKIIRSHVEDGVRLAQQHRLPKRVIDIIHQHHGTCLVSYFYTKAINMGLDVNELDFRYAGPKPQTKIAALVMLADGSEAAVRANVQSGRIVTGQTPAVQTLNPAQASRKMVTISEVVNKIVDDRIKDNQLDECDLTLRDIEQVRRLFVEILTSIYHPRVDYPDPTTYKPSEGQVVSATTVVDVTPIDPARLTGGAADGGAPEVHPALPAKTEPEKESQDTPNNPKPRPTGGIGGAGRLIGKERGVEE